MKIAVMGAGAMGGYLGARLATGGADVSFVARGPHLAAIREHGLKVTSPAGDMLIKPATASHDPAAIGPAEYTQPVVDCGQPIAGTNVPAVTYQLPQTIKCSPLI